mgnify:CR=1 FL=1
MAVDGFDDGYGDPSDYGMSQQDFDDASAVGAQTYQDNQNQQFGMGRGDDFATGNAGNFTIGIDPNRISDNMFTNYVNAGSSNVPNVFDLGGGVGDFGFGKTRSQNFLNPQLAEMYKQQEIARTGADLNKNPFAPNIFDAIAKAFGTSVDRTKDLGAQRVQEINDLRARQAFGLPSLNTGLSYTSKDFEAGRDTNQGMVRDLPIGGIESFARSFIPGANLLPTRAAPERSQIYKQAMVEENAPGILSQASDYISQMGDLFTGLFSQRPQVQDFDQFSPTRDNRQIEDFSQVGATIPDVNSIVNTAKVNREELDSMNRDGTGFASAAGSLYPRTIENSPNYTVPGEENLGMTIDRTGLNRYNLNSVDPNFKTEMNKLNSEEREFLTGRTDTTRGINEDELMADASSFIPQSFKDAGEGLGQLFNEDGVPIGPGNLRFQYDFEKEEPQVKYTIPFTV